MESIQCQLNLTRHHLASATHVGMPSPTHHALQSRIGYAKRAYAVNWRLGSRQASAISSHTSGNPLGPHALGRLVRQATRPSVLDRIRSGWRSPNQSFVVLPPPTLFLPSHIGAMALDQARNLRSGLPTLKPSPMQKAKVLGAGGLACKPQSGGIRPEILVHLQTGAEWPIRVAAVRPLRLVPPWVKERRGLRNCGPRKHLVQNRHDFSLGLLIGQAFHAVRLLRQDGDKQDIRAF